MLVLHINPGNLFGGVETLLVTLARNRGLCLEMEPAFALCFEGRLNQELRVTGVPIHRLPGPRLRYPWTVWRARRCLKGLLRRTRFDAVVCHGCWSQVVFAGTVRACGLPLALWVHDAPTGRHLLDRQAWRRKPDLVLTNSRFTRNALESLFTTGRVEVVHYPVSQPGPFDRELARRNVRSALRTPEGATVVIQVSRLERWKGHNVLLHALARLNNKTGWVCWIVGGAQRVHEQVYLSELEAEADRLGLGSRVQFLGHRTDVAQLLAAADVFCQPNEGPEPFGIVFIEALYAGLPVVTAATGGGLEIVDGTCGLLLPAGDESALAAALSRLLDDGRQRIMLRRLRPGAGPRALRPGGAIG